MEKEIFIIDNSDESDGEYVVNDYKSCYYIKFIMICHHNGYYDHQCNIIIIDNSDESDGEYVYVENYYIKS